MPVAAMTARAPSPTPRRADAVRNRALLLQAARAVFADGGLDVSIDEIVRRAGFAKGTFFRHFPTKDALVEALVTDRLVRLGEIARDVDANHEPGWDAVRTMMERFLDSVAADRSFSESLRGGRPHEGPDVESARRELRAQVARTVAAAQATGEVRPDIAPSDLPMIIGAISSATAPVYRTHPGLGRRYLRLFLDGIRTGTPSDLGAPALGDEHLRIGHAA